MPRSNATINADIYGQIMSVDRLMGDLADKAVKLGCDPSDITDINGTPLVIPLLQIRSNLVLAEAIMKRDVK